jgi:hypothetical protein
MHSQLLTIAILAACGTLTAQASSASTSFDANGVGCQSNGLITGGVVVGATFDASYDRSTGVLDLTVENTTPVVSGEATATITLIHFNLPPGAITGATLISQTGISGAAPNYSLTFDANTSAGQNPNKLGCLGTFSIELDNGLGSKGAIANAAATNISTPGPVIGPVTFSIQLTGPGANGIDAESVLASFSTNANVQTNVGLKFQGGGVGGQESGFVGADDECRTALYTVGNTSPGGQFDLCVTGEDGCHACIWVSTSPGPTQVGSITVPIGLPLTSAFDLGNFGLNGAGNVFCIPYVVPNNPALSGTSFYAVNVTYNALNLAGYDFSEPYEVMIH